MQINIPDKLIPLFTSKARFNVAVGGRDSGKSHTIARILILKALNQKCIILCTRHIQKSIKKSSYSLLVKIIKEYELQKHFDITENEIRCLRTGSKFMFEGLYQNIDNIRSLEDVLYCWVEEANKVSYDAWDVLIPTVRIPGNQLFITFNPDQLDDPVYNMFITHQRENALVIFMNYYDNPFISKESREEIEYCKLNFPEKYKWIYLGECRTTSEAKILHNIVIHDFEIDTSRQPHYGLDFGYQDANAAMQSYIYDNELFICREYYSNQLDPNELKTQLMAIEWLRGQHIIADSSQPAMIKMLNSTGRFQVSGARKSVGQPQKEGAYKFTMGMYLKQFKAIHIHATNCPNAAREFPRWSFETTKNDEILDKVQDGDDHLIDATIYSLETMAKIWYSSNFKR